MERAVVATVADDLLNFFDGETEGLGLGEVGEDGEDAEEEVLEWLCDENAFPPVETTLLVPVVACDQQSRSSAANGEWAVEVDGKAAAGKVPVKPRSNKPRRRRRTTALPPPATAVGKKRCRHCEVDETPQWREGPEGPKTLCNACGVRFKHGLLVPEYRPAKSPTFCPTIHSNYQRRVAEIRRRRAETDAGDRRGRSS